MRFRLACLFPVLLVSLAVSACHSSGHSAKSADGAAGRGGAGAVAFDGAATGSTGGISGAAAGGNATGGNSTTGGVSSPGGAGAAGGSFEAGDGAVAMTPLEACQAVTKVRAERGSMCLGGSAQTYLDYANLCPDSYFDADSNRTVANVTACLGPLAAQTCTDIRLGLIPSCLVNGRRPAAASCSHSAQCQSGMCISTNQQCPTCKAGGLPVGSACTDSSDCQNGSFCHFTTRTCTDGNAIAHAAQGQPCDLSATPVVGCQGDLLCLTASYSSTAGTCTAPPGVGQPCADGVCAAGTICVGMDIVNGAFCALIGACGTTGLQCDPAFFCDTSNGGYACSPRATVGQSCGVLGSGEMTYCYLAYCELSTWTCVAPGASREACDPDHPCAASLSCIAGTCQPSATANCPADGGTG